MGIDVVVDAVLYAEGQHIVVGLILFEPFHDRVPGGKKENALVDLPHALFRVEEGLKIKCLLFVLGLFVHPDKGSQGEGLVVLILGRFGKSDVPGLGLQEGRQTLRLGKPHSCSSLLEGGAHQSVRVAGHHDIVLQPEVHQILKALDAFGCVERGLSTLFPQVGALFPLGVEDE